MEELKKINMRFDSKFKIKSTIIKNEDKQFVLYNHTNIDTNVEKRKLESKKEKNPHLQAILKLHLIIQLG